ncbi:MAG: hypothetical protein IJH61_06170 [Eubacteriaceae bacterium]|nr:hypothetical protein [Eubacteriaceae bacterium]
MDFESGLEGPLQAKGAFADNPRISKNHLLFERKSALTGCPIRILGQGLKVDARHGKGLSRKKAANIGRAKAPSTLTAIHQKYIHFSDQKTQRQKRPKRRQ